jgi:hypothetical protein
VREVTPAEFARLLTEEGWQEVRTTTVQPSRQRGGDVSKKQNQKKRVPPKQKKRVPRATGAERRRKRAEKYTEQRAVLPPAARSHGPVGDLDDETIYYPTDFAVEGERRYVPSGGFGEGPTRTSGQPIAKSSR